MGEKNILRMFAAGMRDIPFRALLAALPSSTARSNLAVGLLRGFPYHETGFSFHGTHHA